jgi:DNA replication protein DnaD
LNLQVETDEMSVLLELIHTARSEAQAVLEEHIERDMMPETVEEFLGLVNTQQDRLATIQGLEEKMRRLSSDNGSG